MTGQSQGRSQKRNTSALLQPSEVLQDCIQLVNSFPRGVEPKTPADWISDGCVNPKKVFALWSQWFNSFRGTAFYDFCMLEGVKKAPLYCDLFKFMWRLLNDLAQDNPRTCKRKWSSLAFPFDFMVGPDGKAELAFDESLLVRAKFLWVLEHVDLSLLRICSYQKCQKLFYAKRTDQKAHSTECNNRRRQAEHRRRVQAKSSQAKRRTPDRQDVGLSKRIVKALRQVPASPLGQPSL